MNRKIGLTLLKTCQKYVKTCGKESILQTRVQKFSNIDIKSLRYAKNLETDTVQILQKEQRWTQNPEKYLLNCKIPNSSVPSHHRIDGWNSSIRDVDELRAGIVDDCQLIGGLRAIKVDKEFAKLTPTEKDSIAYRVIAKQNYIHRDKPFHILEQSQVGDVIKLDEGCAYAFQKKELILLNGYSYKKPLLMVIRIPEGARVSRNMEHGGEILMPRGAEYKLISKELTSDGQGVVVLEYILPTSKYPNDLEKIKEIAMQNISSKIDLNREFAQKILNELQDIH